jgi:hypothetical protein
MSVSMLAARRRDDFQRAAARAAQQLLSTGSVSDRTQARLEQGYRDAGGRRMHIDPTIIDSSGIDTLAALGENRSQNHVAAADPVAQHPAGGLSTAAGLRRHLQMLRNGFGGMPR